MVAGGLDLTSPWAVPSTATVQVGCLVGQIRLSLNTYLNMKVSLMTMKLCCLT